jgi:hypothetical protein
VDRSAGARDCADPPGIQGHGGGGGAWAAARRGRAHGRRRRGGAGFADVGPGLQAITQHGLQAFLWHELARKWLTDREASCTSPLRWGGCWSRSGCPATPRSAVGPDRRGAGEAAHDLVAALLWSLAAELQGSGLLSRRGRHGPGGLPAGRHRRAPGLRPVDAHRHAGRTALAAGRRDLALEVFAPPTTPGLQQNCLAGRYLQLTGQPPPRRHSAQSSRPAGPAMPRHPGHPRLSWSCRSPRAHLAPAPRGRPGPSRCRSGQTGTTARRRPAEAGARRN